MIRTEDAINTARALLGTPYSRLDCIGLIKRVIRTAPGGQKAYTTAGTNTLWNSFTASAKYRDLTWRQEGIAGAQAGMLSLMSSGDNVHHVGLVTGDGTVIHSSSSRGQVVETALDESWNLLAVHRYIEAGGAVGDEEASMDVLYQAVVNTQRDPLNVRNEPDSGGRKLGELLRGTTVDVLAEPTQGWLYVRYGTLAGYASAAYLMRVAYEDTGTDAAAAGAEAADMEPYTTIQREDGTTIRLAGLWRVLED